MVEYSGTTKGHKDYSVDYSSDFAFLREAVRELSMRLDKFEETLKMLVEKDKARLASEAKKNIHNLKFRG